MKEKLENVRKNSYSPYFHFRVAAIVVTKDGHEFSGVNVENANGTSICAERNAIHVAVANGYRKGDFKEIHILGENEEIPPCFACRQVLVEFFEEDALVYCWSQKGSKKVYTIQELCPYPFQSEALQ